MGYSRKNPNTNRGLRIYLFENSPGIFHFFTLSLEIPDKARPNSWIFHKIALNPLEIPRPNTKTPPGNSTLFFLGHPWKSPPLPPGLDFFWNSPCSVSYVNRPMKRKFTQENEQGLFLPKKPKHQV